MEHTQFRSFVVEENQSEFMGTIKKRNIEDLPKGELLIKVSYSSLNYKDALSATGNKGVTKAYPHTPGIDAAGVVARSNHPSFNIGDEVIVTSYDLGMNTDGGFSEYISVPAEWALRLPKGLTLKEAMIFGTAGLTAGISVYRLSQLVKPDDGKIMVSGATGGVGSLSVSILSKLGYDVIAITGKETEKEFLLKLGAKEIILRNDFENIDKRPLLKTIGAGAIDTVGGVILENMIKSTMSMGAITCCGNVSSPKLDITVFPFILRGITLIGIDSQNYPMSGRKLVWEKLASEWKPSNLSDNCTFIKLENLETNIGLMLQGKLKGRIVVDLSE